MVYNPVAGPGKASFFLDDAVCLLQKKKILLTMLRTPFSSQVLFNLISEGAEYVMVSGGDGTVHQVVNCLATHPSPPPLAVLPAGTSNDFALNLRLPSFPAILEKLDFRETTKVDLGLVNDRFFANVASGGLLTDVPHKVDQRLKNNLGKVAYYLQGVAELPNIKTVPTRITCDGRPVFDGEMFLYLILNGRAAGSFSGLAPRAKMDDGKLDLLVFKKCPVPDFLNLFFKVLSGKHTSDPHVLYRQGKVFEISREADIPTDLDGEPGPALPWRVEVLPRKLCVVLAGKADEGHL